MGLPRYLQNKLLVIGYIEEYKNQFIELCVETGRSRIGKTVEFKTEKAKKYGFDNFGIRDSFSSITASVSEIDNNSLLKIFKKQSFKYLHGYQYDRNKYMNRYESQFKKRELDYFLYWQKINGQWTQVVKKLYINAYYVEKAQRVQDERAAAEYQLIIQKEEIDKVKNIEQGRKFHGRLRHLILERDSFKCVLCGRGVSDGVSLEVDHITAWVDGGKTVYDNGQTVCSECNKGKHHAKEFNNKVTEFKKAVSE